ncbi:DUF2975 domain-containing protein [Neptunicella sp.]|uniref:DUF2975 domain-containing protein n=1 Tax=Neptunicella sp. TaxID=2125986 RepID=UPI003F691B03
MVRQLSLLIAWGCLVIMVITPVAAAYLFVDLDAFIALARNSLNLPIHWHSVTPGQWQGLWLLSVLYVAIAVVGLYFLRRAFANFAKGELFNLSNSRDLRWFSIMLFIQALAKPVHLALSSLLLSWNHPAGQKMLTLSMGSDEIKMVALAMILWVMSELLIKGNKLEDENKQFI